MNTLNAAQQKTVASPNYAYDAYVRLWERSRAVCNGERFVKKYDRLVDPTCQGNMLIPFSPTMSQQQYDFYKAEAELPGIVSQFVKMVIGGLLRKKPSIQLPDGASEDVKNWISNEFGQDDSPLTSFLETVLKEELESSRAWVYVDYPVVERDDMSREEREAIKPYPVLWQAEKVINWKVRRDGTGRVVLERVITRELIEEYGPEGSPTEFHPTYIDEVRVHEVFESRYRVRVFRKPSFVLDNSDKRAGPDTTKFEEVSIYNNILVNGTPLSFIPAWPVNGNIEVTEPILMPLIDKEVSLYNKLSRRNHLLYGASTYTPVVTGDLTGEQFEDLVSAGLGTWLNLPTGCTADVLETPTAALEDMDRAIAANIEEMAKLGIRMLTPETDQSGVALHIRNAAQTAQLGSLNNRVSSIFSQIIAFMISWRYNVPLRASDVRFSLSADFDSSPLNEGWLRLATEWYQQGLIPRSVWLLLLKNNDILSGDYDDVKGREEITQDQEMQMETQLDYAEQMQEIENKDEPAAAKPKPKPKG